MPTPPASDGGAGRPGRIRRAAGSLRWRLTFIYAGLLALLLAGFGAVQYTNLQRNLVDVRVSSTRSDLQAAERSAVALATRGTAADRTALARAVRSLCDTGPTFVDAVQQLASLVATAAGQSATVALYDRRLTPLAQSPAGAAIPSPGDTVTQAAATGAPSHIIADGPSRQLVTAFPLDVKLAATSTCGVVQINEPMQPIDSVLATDVRGLAVGGAAVVAIALAAGLLLTSRALRPMRRLTATADRLASGDLRARSGLAPRADEVGILARTFDEMAERIEADFAALARSEQQTRRFIADASHELRTPVTSLKGYIDVLRRGAARDQGALDASLDAMAVDADRMRALVVDLLTLARIDAQRPLDICDVDLNQLVGGLLAEGVPGMPAQVRRDFADPPVVARADPGAVSTIIRNLLVNAVKYAPGAAQRWVVGRAGDRAVLSVSDAGPGIPAADLPHVFERFYRGEKTRAREEGGSGLGLSIVQALARAQGGEAAVESAEGSGSTFTVWLPGADLPRGERGGGSPAPSAV